MIAPLYINYAGLVLLSPYLAMMFSKAGLVVDDGFKDNESRNRAVHLLSYLADREKAMQENELVIHKVLCGMDIEEVVDLEVELSANEMMLADSMLTAVTQHWVSLNNTSINSLRISFLERPGRLEEDEEEAYFLIVEQKSYDMLLDTLPWSISKINLSWMNKIINVSWR